jgi:hypothetical protein
VNGHRAIVAFGAESLRGVEPASGVAGSPLPTFAIVDPGSLFVEESYQRDILSTGVALIRKIVAEFNWASFKPPICVRLDGGDLICIDGQHTATACASHPDVPMIPVMIVDAASAEARAKAFVGHNKNRLGLTAQTIFRAQLAAGEEIAVMVDSACRAAGASIPRKGVSPDMRLAPGTTVAIGTLRAIAQRQGRDALERALRIMVQAGRAPVRADELAAVATILSGGGFTRDPDLVGVISSRSAEGWGGSAKALSADTMATQAVALATLWAGELGVSLPRNLAARPFQRDPRQRVPQRRPMAATRTEEASSSPPPSPEVPKRVDAPAPLKPRPAPPPPRAPDPEAFVRNGVAVNPMTLEVKHGGVAVRLASINAARLVTALAAVMPSMLDFDRLARRVFQRTSDNPQFELAQLIAEDADVLRRAGLEVKIVPKMGCTLFDLGG